MPHASSATSDADLVKLIAAGGENARAAAAEFLLRHRALIRRRIRHKLNASARRLFDSEDLFSTIARRVDQEVERQRYSNLDERQFWGLINRIGDNCITDIAREDKTRRQITNGPLRTFLLRRQRLAERESTSTAASLDEAREAVAPGDDRQLLMLRLLGCPFASIAHVLGLTEASARQRWQRIRRDLRHQFTRPGPL